MSSNRHVRSTLINMGGYKMRKRGVARFDWADPYRLAVTLSWPAFLALTGAIYMGMAAVFALALMLWPGCIANARAYNAADHFFFSLETLSTVGYGEFFPANFYAHSVASVEMVTGAVFTAILTGLTFARFSKPRAKFLFADHPIVTQHDGARTLMVRVGNGRASILSDVQAKVSVLLAEQSKEGTPFRRTYQLKLIRDHLPVFPLTWTLMHIIDEHSPLFHLNRADVAMRDARLFVSLEARDPDVASIVHDVCNYIAADVLFDQRYVDVISNGEDGSPVADMTRLSEVEPAGNDTRI